MWTEEWCSSTIERTTWRNAGCPTTSEKVHEAAASAAEAVTLPALRVKNPTQNADVALYLVSNRGGACTQVLANVTSCWNRFHDAHKNQLGCYRSGHCPSTLDIIESVSDNICPDMLWIRYNSEAGTME